MSTPLCPRRAARCRSSFRLVPVALAVALALPGVATAQLPAAPAPLQIAAHDALPTVTVTGTRERATLADTPLSVGVIGESAIRDTRPTHPQQILGQIPGVAVAVTNGEGHTTAIRQPFTTSPLYLFLEDGIPSRATGFFNHNALYELNLPQAGGIEVIRGPGTALYGSDTIGGIVNVLTKAPTPEAGADFALEAGSYGWRRLLAAGDSGSLRIGALHADLNVSHTDGWRDQTAYDRASATLRLDSALGAGTLKTVLAYSNIDQETGANSPLIEADYLNNPTRNNFPIAFRKVQALRLSSEYQQRFGDGLLSVTPYLRDNSMDLLASFLLSFDPTVSYSQNRSYGVLARWRQDFPSFMRARVIGGVDFDHSPGERQEDRLAVTVSGSGASRVFSAYTTGARIYDYEVTFQSISPYVHLEASPLPPLRVTAGLRWDRLTFEQRNRLAGTFSQGAPTAFYGQVQDGDARFSRASPKLAATWTFTPAVHAYASYNTGFRVPSESQLFRPSVSTTAADAANRARLALNLKPIRAEQVEFGVRGDWSVFNVDAVAFQLDKRDDLVTQRDLATNVTTSVNAGKTRHRGVELGAGWRIARGVRLDAAASYTKHTYEDWVTSAGNFSGKEIESAPRELANLRASWTPTAALFAQLEWVRVGRYWLEASNSAAFPEYPGHDLLNLRTRWSVTPSLALVARAINVTDERYADSAGISSSTPVYSPGLPRTVYAGIEASF